VCYGPNDTDQVEGDYQYQCTNTACVNATITGGYSGDPPPSWVELLPVTP
jgi:hypothetical protein